MSLHQKIILILILLFGSFIFSLPLLRSGLTYDHGIGFWGASGHDMIWHLQLINHIRGIFDIPLASFSGTPLQNYHPLYNFLVYFIHRITGISVSLLVFQVLPLIFSFLYLGLSFKIGRFPLFLFSLFSGSFGWLYTLLISHQFAGESLFWSMQSASFSSNPPLVLSLILIQVLILSLINRRYWVALFILPLLPITKIYGGVAGYVFLGFFSLLELKKYNYKPLFYLLISLPITIAIFFQYNRLSASLIEFNPFWYIQNLFSSPDKVFIPKIASAINTFSLSFNLKLIPLLAFGSVIFYLGNFGFRIIGFFAFLRTKSPIILSLTLAAVICSLLPNLFIQKGTPWNTIQFLYYSLFFLNILSAYFLSHRQSSLFLTIFCFFSVLGSVPDFQLRF